MEFHLPQPNNIWASVSFMLKVVLDWAIQFPAVKHPANKGHIKSCSSCFMEEKNEINQHIIIP